MKKLIAFIILGAAVSFYSCGEGKSEKKVKEVSEKLGFDYKNAVFCSIDFL